MHLTQHCLRNTQRIELHKQDGQTMIVLHQKSGGRRTTFVRGSPGDVARHLRKHSDVEIIVKAKEERS